MIRARLIQRNVSQFEVKVRRAGQMAKRSYHVTVLAARCVPSGNDHWLSRCCVTPRAIRIGGLATEARDRKADVIRACLYTSPENQKSLYISVSIFRVSDRYETRNRVARAFARGNADLFHCTPKIIEFPRMDVRSDVRPPSDDPETARREPKPLVSRLPHRNRATDDFTSRVHRSKDEAMSRDEGHREEKILRGAIMLTE